MRRMLVRTSLCALLALAASATALAADSIRIDASTDKAALASYKLMWSELPHEKQVDLQIAILKINMDGVGSAAEMMADPALRAPTVVRIKDRVAGMTADEIIAQAKAVTSVKLVRPGR